MSEVLLYDLPSKDRCACWSLNSWKARLVLNVKGIPYKTQWLEYPEVAPTLESFEIPPNAEGTPYTLPTIRIGSDQYIMDSKKIAEELERLHPSPSLHLDSPLIEEVQQLVKEIFLSLRGVVYVKVPRAVLNEPSAAYYDRTRAERWGKSVSQTEKEQDVGAAWKNADAALKELGRLLRAEGGPFFLGKTLSFADFVLVGALHFVKRVDEADLEKMVAVEPAFKTLYEASGTWLERDDH